MQHSSKELNHFILTLTACKDYQGNFLARTDFKAIQLHFSVFQSNFTGFQGVVWPYGSVISSWPKGCQFDPGSHQLLGKRVSGLSLTLAGL